ncbi:MAG: hypothetical protein HN380_27775 [Victivallales bacterium]|nr:hypothetical protein [Victivallales bacterium]
MHTLNDDAKRTRIDTQPADPADGGALRSTYWDYTCGAQDQLAAAGCRIAGLAPSSGYAAALAGAPFPLPVHHGFAPVATICRPLRGSDQRWRASAVADHRISRAPRQSHAWRCARPWARSPERATGTHAHTSNQRPKTGPAPDPS